VNRRSKGDRHEREAADILSDLGYRTHKKVHTRYDPGDMFELYDLIAVRTDRRPVFIQVKTNGTDGKLSETLRRSRETLPVGHCDVEYWIRYDREGWRVLRSKSGNDWDEIVDERQHDCNIGEGVRNNYSV